MWIKNIYFPSGNLVKRNHCYEDELEKHMILSRRYFINLVKRYYFTNSFLYFLQLTNIFPCFSPSFVYASVQPKILFSFLNIYSPLFKSLSFLLPWKIPQMKHPPFWFYSIYFLYFTLGFGSRYFLIFLYISRIRPTRTAKMSIISLISSTVSKV